MPSASITVRLLFIVALSEALYDTSPWVQFSSPDHEVALAELVSWERSMTACRYQYLSGLCHAAMVAIAGNTNDDAIDVFNLSYDGSHGALHESIRRDRCARPEIPLPVVRHDHEVINRQIIEIYVAPRIRTGGLHIWGVYMSLWPWWCKALPSWIRNSL